MFVKCDSVYVYLSEKIFNSRFQIEEVDNKIYFIWKNQKQFGNETFNIRGIFFNINQIYFEPFNIHINKQITEYDLKTLQWKNNYSFNYKINENLYFDIETSSEKTLLKSKIVDDQLWIESGSKQSSLPIIKKINFYHLERLELIEHNMEGNIIKKIIEKSDEVIVKEMYIIENFQAVLKNNSKPLFALNIPNFFNHLYRLYPSLEVEFLQEGESTLENLSFEELHWAWHIHYCRDGNSFYRYLLHKYRNNILTLEYEKIRYQLNKKNTLLFIDDRYDSTFIYILILFLFSLGSMVSEWNLTIFTSETNSLMYETILSKYGMTAKIHHLKFKFKYPLTYSYLMCSQDFWKQIPEETVFIFQYDSNVFGKFREEFLKYNFIGALWNSDLDDKHKTKIGNGGTCIRKTRAMEGICAAHKYKGENEDLYFSRYLYERNLHNCPNEVAEKFAFEHVKNDIAAYGHQFYWNIPRDEWETYTIKRWEELFGHSVIYNKKIESNNQSTNKSQNKFQNKSQNKLQNKKNSDKNNSSFESILFSNM